MCKGPDVGGGSVSLRKQEKVSGTAVEGVTGEAWWQGVGVEGSSLKCWSCLLNFFQNIFEKLQNIIFTFSSIEFDEGSFGFW